MCLAGRQTPRPGRSRSLILAVLWTDPEIMSRNVCFDPFDENCKPLDGMCLRFTMDETIVTPRNMTPRTFPYLDEAEKKIMIATQSGLLRKFTELAFDEAAEMRWQESRPAEADNIDVGPATETDFQGDLMETSGDPF